MTPLIPPTPLTLGPQWTSTARTPAPPFPPTLSSMNPKNPSPCWTHRNVRRPPPGVPPVPSVPLPSPPLQPFSGSDSGPLPPTAKSCAEVSWLLRLPPISPVGDLIPSPTPDPWLLGPSWMGLHHGPPPAPFSARPELHLRWSTGSSAPGRGGRSGTSLSVRLSVSC